MKRQLTLPVGPSVPVSSQSVIRSSDHLFCKNNTFMETQHLLKKVALLPEDQKMFVSKSFANSIRKDQSLFLQISLLQYHYKNITNIVKLQTPSKSVINKFLWTHLNLFSWFEINQNNWRRDGNISMHLEQSHLIF